MSTQICEYYLWFIQYLLSCMWSGAICSDNAQCKQIVWSITLQERWGTTCYHGNKCKVLRFILGLDLWRFCWIIHSVELYFLRTEFITLYCVTITVQSREVFILPSIFPSFKNAEKRKKNMRYTVRTYNSLSSCGAFICLVCKCYSKLSQGFVSATLLLRLALTSPSVAHRNALWLHLEMLCSKCDNILICTAMPVNFQPLFQQDNVPGANIPAAVQKWERTVPSSSYIWKRQFWSANHLQMLAVQSGLGLWWQKSRPDNPDLWGQLTYCGSQSTESNSVHACSMLAHFCWETKCCSSLFSFYRCSSAFKPQKPQMGQISNSDISMP